MQITDDQKLGFVNRILDMQRTDGKVTRALHGKKLEALDRVLHDVIWWYVPITSRNGVVVVQHAETAEEVWELVKDATTWDLGEPVLELDWHFPDNCRIRLTLDATSFQNPEVDVEDNVTPIREQERPREPELT